MRKERKLEEFRSVRTSKRRKKKNQGSEEVKIENCFMCVTKTQTKQPSCN